MVLPLLFFTIVVTAVLAVLGMHFYISYDSSNHLHRIIAYLLFGIAVVSLIVACYLIMFQLHPLLKLARQPAWFAGLIVSALFAIVTSMLSEWRVNLITKRVLQGLAAASVVAVVVCLVMIHEQLTQLKQTMTLPTTEFPMFAASTPGQGHDEEVRVL